MTALAPIILGTRLVELKRKLKIKKEYRRVIRENKKILGVLSPDPALH
jgi:hypothetical protein